MRFSSCHDQHFRNVPATSGDFRRFAEDFRTLSKMSEDVPTTFEHLQSFYEVFVIVCISVLYKIIDFMYPDFAEILLVPIALSPSFKQGLAGSTIII